MSFILDALKKSETDRQRQSSPALFEVKVAAPRRGFPLWAVGLAALLGINILVLVWFLLRQPATPAAAATPAATGASGTSGAAIATPAGPGSAPTTVNIPPNASLTITVGANQPDAGVVVSSPEPALVEEPMLAGTEPSVPPDYDARDYAPAITPAEANAAAARRAGGVPSRDEILAQGARLPELRLDLHVYDVEPVKRFVFINMRKLREGETLPEGVQLEAVTPTGARLSYRGQQFTLDRN